MIDCGAIVDEKDWNEELQDYVIYLSREGMLGVNVPFSNIPYPQS